VKRKWFGMVLLGVGAFLLMAGLLATVWAPGVVKKTPLDVNQVTHLDGTVKKLDPLTGDFPENPVKVESITKTDSEHSDGEIVSWVQSTCVVIDVDDAPDCVDGDDERLVSASTDVFATDRVTALAVNDTDYLPADATPHEGVMNKWPFDAEKTTYPFWDGTAGHAVDAVYDRTATLAGIECYVYKASITGAPIEIAEGIDGTYDNQIEIWVEPKTGAIQQQTQDQQRYLADGTQVLDLKIGFTDEQIQQFADDAEANMRTLAVLTVWMPIVGFAGGALCVLAGLALLLSARRRAGGDASAERELAGTAS
jgi:Porin PorA